MNSLAPCKHLVQDGSAEALDSEFPAMPRKRYESQELTKRVRLIVLEVGQIPRGVRNIRNAQIMAVMRRLSTSMVEAEKDALLQEDSVPEWMDKDLITDLMKAPHVSHHVIEERLAIKAAAAAAEEPQPLSEMPNYALMRKGFEEYVKTHRVALSPEVCRLQEAGLVAQKKKSDHCIREMAWARWTNASNEEKTGCLRRVAAPCELNPKSGKKQCVLVDKDANRLADLVRIETVLAKPPIEQTVPKSAAKVCAALLSTAMAEIEKERNPNSHRLSERGTILQQLLANASTQIDSQAGAKSLIDGAQLSRRQRVEWKRSKALPEPKPAGGPEGSCRLIDEQLREMLKKHTVETSQWSTRNDAPYVNMQSSTLQCWACDDDIAEQCAY